MKRPRVGAILIIVMTVIFLVGAIWALWKFANLAHPAVVNNLRCTCVEVSPSDAAPKPEKP